MKLKLFEAELKRIAGTKYHLFVVILFVFLAFCMVDCQDGVVTEVVGHDLLDMEFEEMAAMHDDVMENDFETFPKLFMRGKKR